MRYRTTILAVMFLIATRVVVASESVSRGVARDDLCKKAGGVCIDTCSRSCGGQCAAGKCSGSKTRQCCIPASLAFSGEAVRAAASRGEPKPATDAEAVGVLVGLGSIAGVVMILWFGISRRCSACTKWWALRSVGVEEVDRDHVYKTVPVTEQFVVGKRVGIKKTSQQRRFTRVVIRHVFRCRKCGHETEKFRTAEFEG
ncbi:hypothetical protein KBD49_07015 [Myxococcota bacterium]|nr:hypothetical protein [Myxococcota bacterium]